MSTVATNDIDLETGRGSSSSIATAKKDTKQHITSIIAVLILLIIVGISYTWSSNNNTNYLAMAASSSKASMQQKQNRNLIDLSSWFDALSPPTQSPTRKPTVDMSDWAESLKITPSPTHFPIDHRRRNLLYLLLHLRLLMKGQIEMDILH